MEPIVSRIRVSGIGDFTNHFTGYFYSASNPGSTGFVDFTKTSVKSYRLIGDQTHKYHGHRGGFSYPVGNCLHKTIDTTGLKSIGGRWYTDWTGPNYWDWPSDAYPAMTVSLLESIVPRLSDAAFFTLTREAFNYFSDAFPASMSFSEFILGFQQLRDLLPALQESISKTISGRYLSKKFGWDNLLSDLNVLAGLMRTVRERMLYLKRTYGIPTRLGFYRPNLVSNTTQRGDITLFDMFDANWQTQITLLDYRIDFRSGAWIYQMLDHIDGVIGFIRVMMGALGLNNPVKVFWVNLPFSFVVDWFFNISGHLDSLTRANPAANWSVSNATCSIKTRATFGIKFKHSGIVGGPTPDIRDCGQIVIDHYSRFNTIPLDLADLLPADQLSPNQLTLMLALLNQLG